MPTYTLRAPAVANANDRNMLAINNATGSGKLIKIYRIWCFGDGTGTVTGALSGFLLGRIAGVSSGGTALNFIPHSSAVTASSATPFTGISAVYHSATITASIGTEIRRVFKSSDELAASGGTMEEIQILPAFSVIWDTGYADANVEPLVLRENQGLLIRTDSAPSSALSTFQFWVELNIV
jgi:hypothetical protein